MGSHVDPDHVGRLILDALAPVGAVGTTLVLIDSSPTLRAGWTAGVNRQLELLMSPLSIDHHIPVMVSWRERRHLFIGSREQLEREFPRYRSVDPTIQAMAAFPLTDSTGVVGAMTVSFKDPREFDQLDRAMFEAVAEMSGALLCKWATSGADPLMAPSGHAHEHSTVIGSVEIDHRGRQVWVRGRRVGLTAREYAVLDTLVDHRGQVLSKQQLLEIIWGYQGYNPNVVEAQVSSLRAKIGTACSLIETVRGVGYVIRRGGGDVARSATISAPVPRGG